MPNKDKKILVLTSRFPYPLEKGDKLRLYNQLKDLGQVYHIHLVALSDNQVSKHNIKKVNEVVSDLTVITIPKWIRYLNVILSILKNQPAQLGYFYSPKAHAEINRIIEKNHFDLLYGHLARTWLYLRKRENCIIDLMDSFSEIARVRSNKYSKWNPKHWFWEIEATNMSRVEQEVIKASLASTVISEVEKKRLPKVQEDDKIAIISNGIDNSYFHSKTSTIKTHDLVFVGNLGYNPNIEAVHYLTNKLMPKLIELRPETTLLIAGANANTTIASLGTKNADIVGWLDDIREAYWKGRLMVAPIFLGSGMQNKVLESIACGTAVVATKRVKESFGKMGDFIAECQTEEEFVETILDLLDNEDKRNNMASLASDTMKEYFCWNKSNEKLIRLLDRGIKG